MHGDFSRLPNEHDLSYARVLFQQDRPHSDVDLNIALGIVNDNMRQLFKDIIGPYGTAHARHAKSDHANFAISLASDDPETGDNLDGVIPTVGEGFYYVQGHRCSNNTRTIGCAIAPVDPSAIEDFSTTDPVVLLSNESFRAGPRILQPPFLVYLRVWERDVTALQDARLRDPALNSRVTDTTTRTQLVWQVLASRHMPNNQEVLQGGLRQGLEAQHQQTLAGIVEDVLREAIVSATLEDRLLAQTLKEEILQEESLAEIIKDQILDEEIFEAVLREVLDELQPQTADDTAVKQSATRAAKHLEKAAQMAFVDYWCRWEGQSSIEHATITLSHSSDYIPTQNLLYRVEVVDATQPDATFVWSRNNGFAQCAVTGKSDKTVHITVANAGIVDAELRIGQIVELIPSPNPARDHS